MIYGQRPDALSQDREAQKTAKFWMLRAPRGLRALSVPWPV